MTPRKAETLKNVHQWATITLIPGMLAVIIYFIVDIHHTIKEADKAVTRHEQQITDHERRLDYHDRRIDAIEQFQYSNESH